MRNNISAITGLVIILLVVGLIYLPGLHGPYVLDDSENITQIPSIAISKVDVENIRRIWNLEAFMSHKRPLTSLTFALNYHWAGGFESTWPFKTTNLVIHAINTTLVYGILLLLLSAPRLRESLSHSERLAVAMFGTALWAIHPIQLTNILYVVQRMNSLSTFFVLVGLTLFLVGRQRLSTSPGKALWLMTGGTIGGMVLGITAKENAALLPLYLLIVEYTMFTRDDLSQRTRRQLYLFLAFCLSLPVMLFVAYLATHPEFIANAFTARRFTAYERLLTEGRVLWYYIGLLFIPSTKRLSLFHDDFSLSHGLFDPLSTIVAAIGIATALAFSLLKARRFPVAAFAILWFLVGHSMESTVLNLEIAYEHRNYLPSLGIFFALAYGLVMLCKAGTSRKLIWYGLAAGVVVMLGISTWVRASSWKDLYTFAITEAEHHPGSERANDFAARVSFNEKHDLAESLHYTLRGLNAAPREVGFLIDLHILLAQVPSQYPVTVGGLPISPELTSPDIVTRMLRDQPVSVHGVVSFENLTRCALTPPYTCGGLREQAKQWLSVAADESRTSSNYRAILAADAARFFAAAGDYQQAYTYISRAAAQFPYLPSYKLGVAEYALKLGCFEQVKPMIEQIEQMLRINPPNQTNQASLDKLKEMYNSSIRPGSAVAHTAGHLCYKMDK
jgi:tetratricopeptide (TPR) repeat protein